MRIVCPSCTAAYEVPDDRLAPGREVRCARCGTGWAPLAEEATRPELQAEPTPEPDPFELRAAMPPLVVKFPADQPAMPGVASKLAISAGWALSVALLAGLAWGAYVWRVEIMRAWPPSERAYAALGLA